MPEGPEVRKTVDVLGRVLNGRSLERFEALSGRYAKKPFVGQELFEESLPATVGGVFCKGKFIWMAVGGGFLCNTLGMSGYWSSVEGRNPRARLTLDSGYLKVYYNDTRNFGTFKWVDEEGLQKKLASLGPDVLAGEVTPEVLADRLAKRGHKTVAECLMSQGIICGIGNYLKAEILWASRVSPHRLVCDLSDEEVTLLAQQATEITQRSYRDEASLHEYQNRRFAVYRQSRDPLGRPVKREKTKGGRTTHWVPDWQR